MNAVAIHKDEWSHFRVPATCLVPKMNASFEKLLHRDNVCQKNDPPFLFLRPFLINARVPIHKVVGESDTSHNFYPLTNVSSISQSRYTRAFVDQRACVFNAWQLKRETSLPPGCEYTTEQSKTQQKWTFLAWLFERRVPHLAKIEQYVVDGQMMWCTGKHVIIPLFVLLPPITALCDDVVRA
jgi:hypothetical protein